MKVMVAIDSFKGSVSSIEGSRAISLGIHDIFPDAEVEILPLADGGEGTVDALVLSVGGQLIRKDVRGPLSNKSIAEYGILNDGKTAVIEVSAVCGLPLITTSQRNPLVTTTYGVGELIIDAIEKGCRDFVIGLGGSATNDAGVGMLQALGFSFLSQENEELGLGGGALKNLHKIDVSKVHPELKNCTFRVACDVNNPLYGPMGAAYVYGPQKGATEEMVKELDLGLQHFAQVVQDELEVDLHDMTGAGAAGGLGAAFIGFLKGSLESGIHLVLDIIRLEDKMIGTDFVVTGEGKLDEQTSMGKVIQGIAQMAKKRQIPVLVLAGGVPEGESTLNELGITSYFSIMNAPMTLEKAMDSSVTFNNLRSTTNQLFRLIETVKGSL